MRNLSRVSQLYILGTIIIGTLAAIWSLRYLELANPVAFIGACGLATLLQIRKTEGATARSSYSLSWIVYSAVFVSMGWPETIIVITVAHLAEWLRYHYPWYIQGFNIACYSITTIVAGLIYESLMTFPNAPWDAMHTFAILVAMIVFTLVNHLMIGLVIKLARNQGLRESGTFTLSTLTIDFGLLCLGVCTAFVAQINPLAVIFPFIVAASLQSVLRVPALEREAETIAELARAALAKYEFVATMNHELRTPLSAILLYAESLQKNLLGPLNKGQERAVHNILESSHHLLSTINDILDAAKIDAGKLDVEISSTSIEDVCQSSIILVSEMAKKKFIEFRYERSPDVTQVDVDGLRLKQMLVNLLSNAIKFTPEGGQIGLEVTGDLENKMALFTVWDTGIGISQENLQMLFQPYMQVNPAQAQNYRGTGLGLFLVQKMAEIQGGSIFVTSEVNEGSRFTISLPWNERGKDIEGGFPSSASLP